MVEFVVNEWKKVVIHEIIKYDLDSMFKLRIVSTLPQYPTKPFLWANGVVFDRTSISVTEKVVEEQLDGILHWSSLEFAFMPTYESKIIVDGVVLQIMDVSSNKIFFDMAEFLKKKFG